MKLTEEQIWKCNQTINYENGEVVDGVHICLEHQNVVDFARSIEREIGFARAELWIKRINDAVEAEREECAKLCDDLDDDLPDGLAGWQYGEAIRARSGEFARGTT